MTIQDLKLHESALFKVSVVGDLIIDKMVAFPMVWQITRVESGYIYQETSGTNPQGFFVPLTNGLKSI